MKIDVSTALAESSKLEKSKCVKNYPNVGTLQPKAVPFLHCTFVNWFGVKFTPKMNAFAHCCKSQLVEIGKVMVLTGDPLLSSWLNFGQFAVFNPQPTSKREALNRLIRLIVFFNTVKFIVILLAAWFDWPDLKLYL